MAISVVEAVPASSKPSAADDSMRTFTGGRHEFGVSAPSLNRVPSTIFSGARKGSVISPNMVKNVEFSSARTEEVSLFFSPSAAVPSIRSRVFVYVLTSASVTRRGC